MKNKKNLKSFLVGLVAGGVLVFVFFSFVEQGVTSEKLPKLIPGNTPYEDVVMMDFFHKLNLGEYDMAIPIYSGSYDLFHSWYPNISLNDKYTIWKLVCERKDTYCLPIRDIVSKRTLTHDEIFAGGTDEFIRYDDVYLYEVTYQNPDGSIFQMEPWSWTPDRDKINKFQVAVGKKGRQFVVLTPPPSHN